MKSESIQRLFEFPYNVVRANIADFTHEDSLVQPTAQGNCLNWVLGHIIATRNQLFVLLEETPFWTEAEIERYGNGSKPVIDAADALPWDRLVADHDQSQHQLRAGLARLTEETMARPMPPDSNPLKVETIGDMIGAFLFHEGYHAGQTGILRRILGRESLLS